MKQGRVELRRSMHFFADDVRQGVVADLRELNVAVFKDVDDSVVAVEGRVKI